MTTEPKEPKAKSLAHYVDDFLSEQRAQATRRAYAHAIGDFLKYGGVENFSDLQALDRSFAADYRNTLAESRRRAKTYVNRQLAALRGFFKGLVAQEVLEKSPFDLVRGYKVSHESRTEGLEEEEVARLVTAAKADPVALLGLRDRALLLTLYYEALRRSEAARLSRGDLRRDAGILVLRDTKTTYRDEVSLRPETTEAIDLYLAALDARLPGAPPGRRDPVFVSLSKRSLGKRLSPSAILEVVKKRAREAGIRRNIVAHSLRHAAVTHALDHHASLEETGAHARHRDPRTTARYDRRRKRRGAAAADALPHLAV